MCALPSSLLPPFNPAAAGAAGFLAMIQGGNARAGLRKVVTATSDDGAAATRRMSMPTPRKRSNLEESGAFTRMQQMQDLRSQIAGGTDEEDGDDSEGDWSD